MVEIREADPEDLPAVHSITQKAYAVWLPVLGCPPQPMTDDHGPRIQRGDVLLACEGESVLGLVAIERGDDHHMIFSVAVHPDNAGKGIGPRLIAEAERRARLAGKARMTLYTNALMIRNIALYRKLGYREIGRRPNAARPGFTIVDMEKALIEPSDL
ncbi:GNAT family N-acetyltransferase [Rhizobium sp. C4]|uniref:GNAT family N-acetyltransferase n=1 Tax=Rhizobium sp. C4 TaxID=1349800 RepID=UPI001E5E5951|nr:GNAT family N-acetyltransferase [Rhizobium sp. C4]MCD2175534.1 GNAT family N-acetyltransferase [Rhizobium sp. C4]